MLVYEPHFDCVTSSNFAMFRKPKIYIVDDDPQVLDAISQLVEPIDADVETFSRADDFLRKFHDNGPMCLVLDVRMPGMSGLELQTKLAQAGCHIPIIFVTGYADVRMTVDALKAGAANIFEKPFRPQELFDEIQKLLREDIESWLRRDEEQCVEQKLKVLRPREREVIDLIAEGKTNDEIAKELQLSLRGIEARRAKAMKTLRVDSKAELMQLLRIYRSRKSKNTPA
jgi:two-component system, LuxR family, response regulator FixJ